MNASASQARSISFPNEPLEWVCPLEMVLHVTSSWFKSTIWARCERGDVPDRQVRVFARQNQLFATVRWVEGNSHPLTIALDVHLMPMPEPRTAESPA